MTSAFERKATKFVRRRPDLVPRLVGIVADLERDPFDPRLGLHALHGELAGLHAVRLTYQYRVTLELNKDEQTVTLVNIGGHDEVYR